MKERSDRGDRRDRDRGGRNERRSDRGESRDRRGERGSDRGERRTAEQGFNRYFINIGEIDKVKKGDIVRMICDNSKITGDSIGRIDMKDKFSFVEIEEHHASEVNNIRNMTHRNRSIRINESDDKPKSFDKSNDKGSDKSYDNNSDKKKSKKSSKDSDFVLDMDFKF